MSYQYDIVVCYILKILRFIIILSVFLSCVDDPLENGLLELDEELYCFEQRKAEFREGLSDEYAAFSNAWTDSMVWEAAYNLFDSYSLRNTDSSSVYLQVMFDLDWDPELVFRSKVCRAKSYALINHSRLEMLMPEILDHDVSEAFFPRYCSMMIDIYSHSPGLSSYASDYVDFLEAAIAQESYPPDVMSYYQGLRALAYNNTSDAVHYLAQAYEDSDDLPLKGTCAEYLAGIYKELSNRQLEKTWLIRSSLHHLRSTEGELSSLYRLSLILSDEGDYSRSARYMRTVIERASSSGYPELVVGSATGSLAINATLDRIDRTRQTFLFCALGGAIIALLVILFMLVRDRKNSRLLLRTKESLIASNEQLVDTNKIKDGYLIRYMNLSISYLGMIEDNRRMLRRKLKEEGVDALAAELRKTSTTFSEYKEFYKTFDNIFLGIYPDFVAKTNECFRPEDRFKENGKLTTPLRILALIRLGYTESGEIARFLNCSPETIYSHRSKLKAKAICDRLEDRIKCIGK